MLTIKISKVFIENAIIFVLNFCDSANMKFYFVKKLFINFIFFIYCYVRKMFCFKQTFEAVFCMETRYLLLYFLLKQKTDD